MNFLHRWQERRHQEWWAKFQRQHRCDGLAAYNSRRWQGVLHTPEYEERMRAEQEAFYKEAKT